MVDAAELARGGSSPWPLDGGALILALGAASLLCGCQLPTSLVFTHSNECSEDTTGVETPRRTPCPGQRPVRPPLQHCLLLRCLEVRACIHHAWMVDTGRRWGGCGRWLLVLAGGASGIIIDDPA